MNHLDQVSEVEKQLAEKLGFWLEEIDNEFFRGRKLQVAHRPGEMSPILADSEKWELWRELLSTTEKLERLQKAAIRAADHLAIVPGKCCKDVGEALRKELL